MAIVTLRAEKGDLLTHNEVDANFEIVRSILQKGAPQWDATANYIAGARVFSPTTSKIYKAQQPSLGQDPATDSTNTYWEEIEDITLSDLEAKYVENVDLQTYLANILTDAPIYNSATVYGQNDIVQDTNGIIYVSVVNGNEGNLLSNASFWEPVNYNIADDQVSTSMTWSSNKVDAELTNLDTKVNDNLEEAKTNALVMSIALG